LPTRHVLAVALLALFATSAHAQNKCAATGVMAGESFAANNCVVAFFPKQNSVTLWFSETPITPREQEAFQASAYVESTKAGKDRTMLLLEFCPGGGQVAASADAIKTIDLSLNHGKAPVVDEQWSLDAPADFKVESIAGDVRPGARLNGRITGARKSEGKPFAWDLAFDVALPAKAAGAGASCGK